MSVSQVSLRSLNPDGAGSAFPAATVRVHIWIESHGKAVIGLGRATLLRRIQQTGSLKRAAEGLNMSYRAAWGKIRQSEAILGQALIAPRGGRRAGHELTPFGLALLRAFDEWFLSVETYSNMKSQQCFPFETAPFEGEEAALAT